MRLHCVVPATIEGECAIVPKAEENLCAMHIVKKNDKDPCEVTSKTKEDMCEIAIINYKEVLPYEKVLGNEKYLCDSTLPEGLQVKPSNLCGGTMGVFALLQIESDFQFGPYIGER